MELDDDDVDSEPTEFEVREILRRRLCGTGNGGRKGKKARTATNAAAAAAPDDEDPALPPSAYEYFIWWQGYSQAER